MKSQNNKYIPFQNLPPDVLILVYYTSWLLAPLFASCPNQDL